MERYSNVRNHPNFWWFIPPIKMVIRGMVYDIAIPTLYRCYLWWVLRWTRKKIDSADGCRSSYPWKVLCNQGQRRGIIMVDLSEPWPWVFPNGGLTIFVGPRKSWQLATKDTDLRMGSDQEDDADDGDDLAKIYDHLDALAALQIQ